MEDSERKNEGKNFRDDVKGKYRQEYGKAEKEGMRE